MQNLFSAYRYQRLIRLLADWKGHVRVPASPSRSRFGQSKAEALDGGGDRVQR